VPRIRRALISVSDKSGLLDFARTLRTLGVEILSTGGTAASLREAGIEVTNVSSVTGFPEIMDGRVKTLHPKIHGALLGVTDNPDHVRQMDEHGIVPIDMVVVNLYPFRETVAKPGVTLASAVENIDIGGPSMLRSAAKNFRCKAVIVDPARYEEVVKEMGESGGSVSEATCAALAREVFHHTSSYDAAIAAYLDAQASQDALPARLVIDAPREQALRYGENPHQRAALYGSFSTLFRPLHGKELSFNNIMDLSAASQVVAEFDEPAVAIIKHMNPCGVGQDAALAGAYAKALATDTTSAFGGIVAVNRRLDLETARRINEVFTEVIVAPDFPADVLELLRKKKDRRLVQLTGSVREAARFDIRTVPGGFLVQDPDVPGGGSASFRVVTRRAPTPAEETALRFAWRIAKHVKSNAIVYTGADRTLGVGAGQMSRIDSSRIAVQKAAAAGLDLRGSVVASDAFFPFPDGLLEAVKAGSTAVIQPGGSVRDADVIAAADEHGIAMVFTGVRHFRH
jgi:phosphoribosylaminoimidazolecarboxamide formyltransferase / IMP cyclohydrolase